MTIPYEMESAPFSNIFGTLLNEKFYVVRWKPIDVLEEYVASVFWVEE
jgi:hypothetical protein